MAVLSIYISGWIGRFIIVRRCDIPFAVESDVKTISFLPHPKDLRGPVSGALKQLLSEGILP